MPEFMDSYEQLGMDEITHILMAWYDVHRRDLPWRETSDPYAIWLSEVILQQTRVAQGRDYYLRFLREFPTVESLAGADEDRVMCLWQGLGYYSRARNLHAAARQVVAMGGFPTTFEGLRGLRGVGDYTAAAIASFAFGQDVAVVDGNVLRVVSRLFGIVDPIDTAAGKQLVASLTRQLLPVRQSARYNQAVMEFGALQCVPGHPDCVACPLAHRCMALAQGLVAQLPVKSHRPKVTERWFNYFYVHDSRFMYIHKRTGRDIWHGLYELPLTEGEGEASPPLSQEGLEEATFRFVRRVRHVLTHQIIHATLYEVVVPDPLPPSEAYNLIRIDDRDRYAFPRLIEILLPDD